MKKDIQNAAIDTLVEGNNGSPKDILGVHKGKAGMVVRTFQPYAQQVEVALLKTDKTYSADKIHDAGLFECHIPGAKPFPYRLRMTGYDTHSWEIEDPYRFPDQLSDFDLHIMGEGTDYRAYKKMGAHTRTIDGVAGVHFAVWAPNALRVSVIGWFNRWDGRHHPMQRRGDSGVWELFIPELQAGDLYKFEIKGPADYLIEKSDPYAFASELRPQSASVITRLDQFQWHDEDWMRKRPTHSWLEEPMSVYEVHLGSWRRNPEEGNRFLTYRELAEELIPYVKDLGFTHIELLPITEHPFDGSWGYQTIGYFAPTSRFGTPEDFQYFVDQCHQAGIGVIVDWVPAHFPKDGHGLSFFDGTHLYEHADWRKGEHKDWGTYIFNYGRNEVRSFLLSSAFFWADVYHIDGLRVDAVASMLYLDYSRKEGEWIPNEFGGNENLEAVDFVKRFNELIHKEYPGFLTYAEESTAWPMVSRPIYLGGLGFDLKWNMGWMNDMLEYISKECVHRKYHHNNITFSLLYAFTENFILPFSHDEVVHGKRAMLDKMPGDVWQKFANLRLLYAFMHAHPGKKLLFMGCEFGQWDEWDSNVSLPWNLLDYEPHRNLQSCVRDLNRIHRELPEFHEEDFSWAGFEWVDFRDADQSVVSFIRRAKAPHQTVEVTKKDVESKPDGKDDKDTGDKQDVQAHKDSALKEVDEDRVADPREEEPQPPIPCTICVFNFTPVPREGYRIGVPYPGMYREIFNSDSEVYGGSNMGNSGQVEANPIPWEAQKHSILLKVPPLGAVFLRPEQFLSKVPEDKENAAPKQNSQKQIEI